MFALQNGGSVIGQLFSRIVASRKKGRRQIRFDQDGHFNVLAMTFGAACSPAGIDAATHAGR